MQDRLQGRFALVLLLVVSFWGCARHRETGLYAGERSRIARMDDFEMFLMKAGVTEEELPSGETWTVEQANDLLLWLRFKISDGNMPAYGPRVLASFLLEEALKTGQGISRRSLTQGLRLHTHLVVLSPDGHLVRAYSGAPIRCVGPLHLQGGVPGAGAFRVNAFYVQVGDGFREDMQLVAPVIFMRPLPKLPPQRVANDASP